MKLRAVYSDNISLPPGATGATVTRPAPLRPSAAPPVRAARRGAGSRGHSAAPESTRTLEGRQTARTGMSLRFFGCLRWWKVSGPQHRQQRIGPHGQGDMPIPPRPTPDLIVIQAHFALGRFKAALNRPPRAGNLHGLCQCRGVRGRCSPTPRLACRPQSAASSQRPVTLDWHSAIAIHPPPLARPLTHHA